MFLIRPSVSDAGCQRCCTPYLYAFVTYGRGCIAAVSPKAVLTFRFRFCATPDVVRAGDTASCN